MGVAGTPNPCVIQRSTVIYTLIFLPSPEDTFSFPLEREEVGVGWREREKNIGWLPSHTHPDGGLNLQPGYAPQPGTEPATFCSMGPRSNQLTRPVRAVIYILNIRHDPAPGKAVSHQPLHPRPKRTIVNTCAGRCRCRSHISSTRSAFRPVPRVLCGIWHLPRLGASATECLGAPRPTPINPVTRTEHGGGGRQRPRGGTGS